jgi:TPR repeat protein
LDDHGRASGPLLTAPARRRNQMQASNVGEIAPCSMAWRQPGNVRISRAIAVADRNREACFELGVAYSTGEGVACDLIEAHMWFNLAAARGHREAANLRADISAEMTAREIADAQRRARQWLASSKQRAA